MQTRPLIVAGMHRSGTSLVASLCVAFGVDMGAELLRPDANNPTGYFEDIDFMGFNGRLLEACTRSGDGGHRDWGWTESEELDLTPLAGAGAEAAALVAARAGKGLPWGWKDPRTTLLLDFWDSVAHGEARFIFVYRNPWDVADSMQRLAAPVFLEHPEYAYRIWAFYNRRLLDFARRHRERSALVSATALVERPREVAAVLKERLGMTLGDAGSLPVIHRERLRTLPEDDPLVALVAATSPDCVELLCALDKEADLTAQLPRGDRAGASVQPKVEGRDALSVVIPCCNHGQLLIEAVASVERAAHGSRLAIVNDGSTQARTLEVLDVLRHRGYVVIDQPNRGLSAARNAGIGALGGRYLLPLDADNRLRPGFVDAALSVLAADAGVGVVYGDWWEFGMRNGLRMAPEYDPERILWSNFIDACAVMRWEVWEWLGGYDESMVTWEDWDLWIRASVAGWRFHKLPGVTFDYRVRPGSLISETDAPEIAEALVARVVEKNRELYLRKLRERVELITWWPLGLERGRATAEARASAGEDELQVERAASEDLRADVERLKEGIAGLEAEVARWQAEREEWRQKSIATAAELVEAQRERDAEVATSVVVKAERDAARSQLEFLSAERDAARSQLALVIAERDAARSGLEAAERHAEHRAAELGRITSTRGWAVLSWYWRLAERVGRFLRRGRRRHEEPEIRNPAP